MPDELPVKTSRPLHGSIAARALGVEGPYIDAIFRRYWERNDASITRRYKLEDINQACDDLHSGKILGRAIIEY